MAKSPKCHPRKCHDIFCQADEQTLKVFRVHHFPPQKGCKSHGLLSLVWNKLRPGFRRDWICGHRSRCQNRVCLQITQECSLTQLILELKSHNLEKTCTQYFSIDAKLIFLPMGKHKNIWLGIRPEI